MCYFYGLLNLNIENNIHSSDVVTSRGGIDLSPNKVVFSFTIFLV